MILVPVRISIRNHFHHGSYAFPFTDNQVNRLTTYSSHAYLIIATSYKYPIVGLPLLDCITAAVALSDDIIN